MDRPLPRPTLLHAASCVLLLLSASLVTTSAEPERSRRTVHFNRDVRPLLASRCFACHGPDAADRKAGLRLDVAEGPDGAYRTRRGRTAVQPGSPEESELWLRVTATDEFDVMPPPESHQEPFEAEELDVLRRWIEEGAVYEEHWAFVAPEPPVIPTVEDEDWPERTLDRFVLHAARGRGPATEPRGRRPHADPARDARPDRAAADEGRGASLPR